MSILCNVFENVIINICFNCFNFHFFVIFCEMSSSGIPLKKGEVSWITIKNDPDSKKMHSLINQMQQYRDSCAIENPEEQEKYLSDQPEYIKLQTEFKEVVNRLKTKYPYNRWF